MIDSTAVAMRNDLLSLPAMPTGRLWRAYLTEAKYESLRTLRMPGFAAPFLALPVALYLLFGVVLFGDALRNDASGAVNIFLAFSVMGVMGPGIFGFGVFVATEREQGLLTLKRALPTPPASYLLAKMLMAMFFAVIIMATMILAAVTFGHLRLAVGQFFGIAVVNIFGALPFCALGLLIGTRASAKGAPAFVNLLYLPMIYLSGFFFPLPKSIHWIQFASPAYYLDQLALRIAGAPSPGATMLDVAILAGTTLLFGAFAVRRLARIG